jgi:hypothetical protein
VSSDLIICDDCRNNILTALLRYVAQSQVVYDFVLASIVSFPSFWPFRDFYAQVAGNVGVVLKMLDSLVKVAPIVDSYLIVDAERQIQFSPLNRTCILWGRVPDSFSAKFFTIRSRNHVIEFVVGMMASWLKIDGRSVVPVAYSRSFDQWKMISVKVLKEAVGFTVNLSTTRINIDIEDPILFIGDDRHVLAIQSLRVFTMDVILPGIFARGPNYQDVFCDNLACMRASYWYPDSFISSYYKSWLGSLAFVEPPTPLFSLSAPFQGETKALYRGSFLTPLELHGGLDLVIHLIAEAILKSPHLHELLFRFIRRLIDKFPIVDQYFVKRGAYKLIGDLLQGRGLL